MDGVDVEDVRRAPSAAVDPRLDALETAASLVAHAEVGSLLDALARRSLSDFQSDWAVVVDLDSSNPVVTVGTAPPAAWLAAFVAGSRASGDRAPMAVLTTWPGRTWTRPAWSWCWGGRGGPFDPGNGASSPALARIVDHRWAELHTRAGRLAHPSALSF